VTKCDRDRHDLWPASPRDAIEVAHQLREEVVGVQFLNEQLQERPRAVERRRTCGKQPHGTRALLLPPSVRIELLFCPCGVFELTVDVRDCVTDFAHGYTSRSRTRTVVRARLLAEGPGRPRF
jgi:hypothetical protein